MRKLQGGFIGFLSGRRRRATEVRCALDKRKSWQSSLPALRTFLPCCHPVALSFPTFSFYSMELWVSYPEILRQNSNIRFQFQIYCCQLNYGTSQADMFFQHMLNQTSPIFFTSVFFGGTLFRMSKIEYIYFDFVNLSHYSIGREINQMQQIIRRLSVFHVEPLSSLCKTPNTSCPSPPLCCLSPR